MSSERPQPATPSYRPLSLFAYTVEASAPLYRAIMHLFLESKERYRIQLRTDEVAAELARATAESPDRAVLDRALDQLHAWGNLRRSHDTGRVATLEDFRRRHFVYQLTPAGEAAERAVGRVIEALESSGSLQRVMLGAILRSLKALAEEARAAEPRPALLYEHLFIVAEQFRSLTENAGTFLARLHEAIDAGEVDTTTFLIYKQAVLEYLEQFVGELAERTPEIAAAIREIDEGGAARVLALAAEADATPTPEGRRDRSAELERQWRGIGAWFVGDGLEPPTVEHLRGAARAAINRILLVLERLHEKRFRRVDRTADLLRLAGWFELLGGEPSGAGDDGIHRLFASAFGLFGARHLGGAYEDPDAVAAGESWWQAPAVPVAPVLRRTGRTMALGRTPRVVDHDEAKRFLAERHRRERVARAASLERFADRGPLELAALDALSRGELDLLLAFLDRLLSAGSDADGLRRAVSRDGLLELRLEEPVGGRRACIRVPGGRIDLPAYVLTVTWRAPGWAASA